MMTMGCIHAGLMITVLLMWLLVATIGEKRPSSPSLLVSGGRRTRSMHEKVGRRTDSRMSRTSVKKNKRKRKGDNDNKGKMDLHDDNDHTVPADEDENVSPASPAQRLNASNSCLQNSSSKPMIQQASTSFNVTCLTWNMAELSPTEDDCTFMKSFRSSDMVVLGVQECEDIKPRRHEGD